MKIANALASQIIGDISPDQTSAGTTQADATTAIADHVQVATVATGTGVILAAGNASDLRSVANCATSNNLFVYPPVGAAFNGRATNAAIDLPAGACALFIFLTTNKINVIA